MRREAVIVSVARTPIGQAFRGSLNNIKSPRLAAHAIQKRQQARFWAQACPLPPYR